MNPAELRMMWMSQYNPERITLEDAATYFGGHSSVNFSVMDELQQQTMDLNPMMSLVSGDFSGQAAAAAAAAAALGAHQPNSAAALIAGNSAAAAATAAANTAAAAAAAANTIYGLAQMGGLHQQLLQQSAAAAAAAAFHQNYSGLMDEDETAGGSGGGGANNMNLSSLGMDINGQLVATTVPNDGNGGDQQQQQQLYEDAAAYDDPTGSEGLSGLTPKQEYINIDDFVMMTDSNSYDEDDEIDEDADADGDINYNNLSAAGQQQNDNDHLRLQQDGGLIPMQSHGLITPTTNMTNAPANSLSESTSNNNKTTTTATTSSITAVDGSSSGGVGPIPLNQRSQRKTRKIEPVNRPGLVLKTPIAYKGNIDPSVIPIQKDGMAVCERCGAIGVKHTFYTKSRRFCSMSCARGELYSLVLNSKMTGGSGGTGSVQEQQQTANTDGAAVNASSGDGTQQQQDQQSQAQQHTTSQSDIELALRVAHIKSSNYRFRITDQSKITQINGYGEPIVNSSTNNSATDAMNANELLATVSEHGGSSSGGGLSMLASTNGSMMDTTPDCRDSDTAATGDRIQATNSGGNNTPTMTSIMATGGSEIGTPKSLRMYRDVMPQDEIPQIPKLERLPTTCPQMEKIISIRRRLYDPSHSYDWSSRLPLANFYAAPVTCFPHAPGYEVWDNIGIGMKVEVENTDCDNLEVIQPGQTPHSFWVATILNIQGYKALMRYEGFDDATSDFWVNLCNAEVHSVGWCATRGKPLIPPRSIENKYKDWKDFLVERLSGARTLPSSFYNKINDSMQSRFRLALNLECVDKDRISRVRLATVTKIVGKRLFLRYFDSDDGFWCHEDSPIIHPVGWATTVGHNLAAPQDYLERMLAGREAMIEVHEDDATIELFKMNFTFEEYYLDGKANGFLEGMKLEAVDPLNLSSICAATVMAVLKFGYMMIRIDSYQPDATGSDWFCYHEKSPSIFPVGFCDSNNIVLTPPNGYDVKTFNWDVYLTETSSTAADQQLFHRVVPNHGFEVGMSLECADLMDPRLVCVATVARVVGRLLKIHFDGWTDEYDQWLDCESPDVYPVGWCFLVSHKLEGPPAVAQPIISKTTAKSRASKKRKKKPPANTSTNATNQKMSSAANIAINSSTESAVKSRTIALKTTPHLPKLSIKLELKPEHHNAAFYEDAHNNATAADGTVGGGDNEVDEYDYEDTTNSNSNSHRSNQSTPQLLATTATSAVSGDLLTANASSSMDQNTTGRSSTPVPNNSTALPPAVGRTNHGMTVKKTISPAPPSVGRKATSYIGNSTVSSSKYIPRLTDTNDANAAGSGSDLQSELMPDSWNVYDVSQFLRVNDCTAHCDTFSRNKIDGRRLLQLSKDDVITLLGMKVGPALKIYDLIQQLKSRMNPGKSGRQKIGGGGISGAGGNSSSHNINNNKGFL